MRALTNFSLENFRLFKDKTSFDLAPITILTGTNSSGKSSLIKAMLLLKSNFEKNKSIEEIDFSIGDHNLNDFKNSLNYDSDRDIMCFFFSSHLSNLGLYNISIGYKLDRKNKAKGKLYSFKVHSLQGEEILYASRGYDDELTGPYIKYKIDIGHIIKNLNYGLLLNLDDKLILNGDQILYDIDYDSKEYQLYLNLLEFLKISGIDADTGVTENEMKHSNQSIEYGIKVLGQNLTHFLERKFEEDGLNLKRSKFGDFFYDLLSRSILGECFRNIVLNFESISNFDSIRSESKRFYVRSSDSITSFLSDYKYHSAFFNSEIKEFIQRQLSKFLLGEEIIIQCDEEEIIFKVFLKQKDRNVLLSDLGFGYTQLLPVIMKIVLAGHLNLADQDEIMAGAYNGEQPYYKSLFLLQEPEANLHPSFQTKIADLIVEANKKFNIRFIVETHSEYLIRKLQYLTATKKLNVDDTSILYFHQKDTEDHQKSPFRSIRIKENGRLSLPFGSGFFDEADRISFELYRLTLNEN
jgi:AAA15 family ATPase/GTPase